MKKMIAALAVFLASSASATEVVAYWFLPSGHSISIHTGQLLCKDGRNDAMATHPNGSVLTGCWRIAVKDGKKQLLIQLHGDEERAYDALRFTIVE
jgi:hypothetical protein